ncbi:hypothetical protein BDP55DRAFT_302333 [Colletotrichum godetiae]|uniref:Uncharacterized protein n=1 Tax=Colletotrichum godetiae TaxID=1209918 RepID=A0AAJ0AUL7_9PEZI|nr:uncharacterized protein BDP55DRAFT_302333 [Colletotrichum godetiae]KAK1690663.1 hypothetical protein BDP55DRAFT_302333 [Colletotrichum godetiae]
MSTYGIFVADLLLWVTPLVKLSSTSPRMWWARSNDRENMTPCLGGFMRAVISHFPMHPPCQLSVVSCQPSAPKDLTPPKEPAGLPLPCPWPACSIGDCTCIDSETGDWAYGKLCNPITSDDNLTPALSESNHAHVWKTPQYPFLMD